MSTRPTWVEIFLPQLAENCRVVREHVGPERALMAVVKADAYGHGLPRVASTLARCGVDWFGVTSADEGIELRELGISQPILLLTGFWEGEQKAITDYDLVPAVYSEPQLAVLESWASLSGKRIRFHLKVNTGMGRLGIHWQQMDAFLKTFSRMPHLELEGVFSQFASAEDFTSKATEIQAERFQSVVQELARAGVHARYSHQANSAAVVSRPETWGNMVRPGLLLYGYQVPVRVPEGEPGPQCRSLPVHGIMTFRTHIIAIQHFSAGVPLGYGGRHVTPRESRIAVIPAGYADGLDRRLSGCGKVIICGHFAPIVGNISMDLTLLDITDLPEVTIGEEVILIGRKGESSLTAVDLAEACGTIPYEILCGISKRVPRRYLS
ncbi:MAG: alanine racemase [Acidobacteria bacterium]|nr:alanine racemase [Acidobacteriota bacterium]